MEMAEYLNTLGGSELINFLELESDKSENFEIVGELLAAREKKTRKEVEDLEKKVRMYRSKCRELSNSLDEKKKKGVVAEGNVDELGKKVSWLEGECRAISEREKKAVENVGKLSGELEKIGKERHVEFLEFQKDLESVKENAAREVEEERERYKEAERLFEHALGKLENDLDEYKRSCSDLGNELQEEKMKTREVEGKLEGFKKYKIRSDELDEKIIRVEKDCEIVTKREKMALENAAALSADLEKMGRDRMAELDAFEKALECEKQKAANEMKEEKKRYTELEDQLMHSLSRLEKDLDLEKRNSSKLSLVNEENEKRNIELQSKIEAFKKYEVMCVQLREKAALLQESSKILDERKNALVEKNEDLLAAFKKYERDSNAELNELKTKNKDLESAKLKAEDELKERVKIVEELEKKNELLVGVEKDLEIYKVQCADLSTKLEEEKQNTISIEGKLEEFQKHKTVCDELKEKVSGLEKKNELLDEMEKDLERYKARCSDLSTGLEEEKQHTVSMKAKFEDSEKYKTVSNELNEKVSRLEEEYKIFSSREKSALDRIQNLTGELEKISLAKSVEVNELKEQIKVLESAKQKAEKEVKSQKERYKKLKIQVTQAKNEIPASIRESLVPENANCEDGAEDKEGKLDKKKEGAIESEVNDPLSAASSPKLKIKLKDRSFVCDGEVRDHMSSVSVCSAAKACGDGPVPVTTFKRKRTSKSRKSDGGSADHVGIEKVKMDHYKAMNPRPCDGKKRKLECSPLTHSVTKETSNTKAEVSPVENSQEKPKTVERQSKRTIHPPVRLDL